MKNRLAMNPSGILDMKWCPHLLSGKVVIAIGCSDGRVLLKCVDEKENGTIKLSDRIHHNLAEDIEKMVLSVDWSLQNEGWR